jgi:glucokinase
MLLGVDIGGTKVALALAEPGEPRLVAKARYATPNRGDADRDMGEIVAWAEALLAEHGVARADLSAVGLSVPGPVDFEQGLLVQPPNLPGWRSVPVRDAFAAAFDCPVVLENDANAAALAEWRLGAGRGTRDFVYLTMSTGVGGGLVLDGRLHRGRLGTAGELGHVPVELGGKRCACGLRGCLEAYVGGRAWTNHLRATAPADSRLVELAGGDATAVTTRHLLQAAREGCAFSLGEVDAFNRRVAQAIAGIAFSLSPEVVALGTIVVAAGDALMLDPIRALVREMTWPHQAPHMRIEPAELGEELGEWAGVCAAMEAEPETAAAFDGAIGPARAL